MKQLGLALIEASESDDPKGIDLALDLLERAALRFRRRVKRSTGIAFAHL